MPESLFTGTRLCLAPLAGYSDAPMRLMAAECGADFAFTGLVSAEGLVRGGAASVALLRRLPGEGPLGVQLFGADAGSLARAAVIAAEAGASFVDLNFGCPVKKVVRKNGGASIMRDLELMERIARAVVAAAPVPVTAKIRSGWSDEERNFLAAGRLLEACGIAAVTLHPRPRSRGFSGAAHWADIAALRAALSIPVIANGDVASAADHAAVTRETGCAAVMIGRGAIGNPWIFREIRDARAGRTPRPVSLAERIDAIERHARLMVECFGPVTGVREMRKFYRWYLRGIGGAKAYRSILPSAADAAAVAAALAAMREELQGNERDEAAQAS